MHHNCYRKHWAQRADHSPLSSTCANDWKYIPAKVHAVAPCRYTWVPLLVACINPMRSIRSATIALTWLLFFSSFSGPASWLWCRAAQFCAIASNVDRLVFAALPNRSHSQRIRRAVRPDDQLKKLDVVEFNSFQKIENQNMHTSCVFRFFKLLLLLLLLFIGHRWLMMSVYETLKCQTDKCKYCANGCEVGRVERNDTNTATLTLRLRGHKRN